MKHYGTDFDGFNTLVDWLVDWLIEMRCRLTCVRSGLSPWSIPTRCVTKKGRRDRGREEGGKIKIKPNVTINQGITKKRKKERNPIDHIVIKNKGKRRVEGRRGRGGGGRKKNQTQAFITSCSGCKGKQRKDNRGGRRMHTHTNTYIYVYIYTRTRTQYMYTHTLINTHTMRSGWKWKLSTTTV